jgi:hypothetical protein
MMRTLPANQLNAAVGLDQSRFEAVALPRAFDAMAQGQCPAPPLTAPHRLNQCRAAMEGGKLC